MVDQHDDDSSRLHEALVEEEIENARNQFINIVEELLKNRRDERRNNRRASDKVTKKYNGAAIDRHYGFSWFANRNRMKMPPREIVMLIADYIECNDIERNRLLLAAGHAPEQTMLEGEHLRQVLRPLQKFLKEYINLPAYIVNRDFTILDVNKSLADLFEISEFRLRNLITPDLNLLELLIDPELPIRARAEAISYENWQRIAVYNFLAFKLDNKFAFRDEWYIKLMERLSKLENFDEFDKLPMPADLNKAPRQTYQFELYSGTVVTLRSGLMRLGIPDLYYPTIFTLMPEDETTIELFRQRGFLPNK